MLILLLTLAFLFVCLVSSAAAVVSSVCAWIYGQKIYAHFRRCAPQKWAEVRAEVWADPRLRLNPMRVLALLTEAANGDERVRLYAERVHSWHSRSAIAFAAAIISGLILGLLGQAE